jgi:hypothetical protein
MEKFVEIIDNGECCSTMNDNPNFNWPEPWLKNVACKNEWNRHDFYPSNGLVAEVYCDLEDWGYILLINEEYYVPMTKRGVKSISEEEYKLKSPKNKIRGMDQRQRNLNTGLDHLYSNLNDIFGIQYEEEDLDDDLNVSEFYNKLKGNIENLLGENGIDYIISENDNGGYHNFVYDIDNYHFGIIWIKIVLDESNNLVNFLINGLNPKITQMANEAETTKKLFRIPIFKYMLLDEDHMIVTMLVMPKNW